MTPGPVHPTARAGSSGSRARPRLHGLTSAEPWRFGGRLLPFGTFLAIGVVGCAWAVARRLDAPIEATVLALITSIPLSVVLVDEAAALTAPAVVPLAWRRVVPAVLGASLATATWLLARAMAALLDDAPWPGRWGALEWVTVAATQLAAGAVAARRRPASSSFGPGLLVGLLWTIVLAAPRLHQQLFDQADHAWRWLALLGAAAVVVGATSQDPARRLPRR